jgi:hypothetical protein
MVVAVTVVVRSPYVSPGIGEVGENGENGENGNRFFYSPYRSTLLDSSNSTSVAHIAT